MISEAEVTRVAHLARLTLSAEETKKLSEQLSSVLRAFEHVSKINTDGVEALVTPSEIEQYWREDKAEQIKAASEAAMQNAPESVGNLFKVPPVVG